MIKFEADLQSRRFENQLRIFSSTLGGILKELMAETGKEMAAETKSKAAGAFTSRTGNLVRAVNFIPTDQGVVLTTRKTLRKPNIWYANIVENGANVKATGRKPRKRKGDEKYLIFKINGEWKKVSSVRVRPRPFMTPVFNEYWEGENAKGYRLLANALQKKMEEYLG
jgi:hypothetical protein